MNDMDRRRGWRQWSRTRRRRFSVTVLVTAVLIGGLAWALGDRADPGRSQAVPPGSTTTAPGGPTPSAPGPTEPGGAVRDSELTTPLAGMPAVPNPANIYADAGANMLSPAVRGVPYRIYVPNSGGSTVTVIDPSTYAVLFTYQTGLNPQHVVPAYDLRTLYVTNDLANSLTPIDPRTGLPAGPNIAVDDPYNMYFTPDGRFAVVVAEARQHLDFRDPHTFALEDRVTVNCAGVDHVDFAANGAYLIATCEFAGRLVRVNLHTLTVDGYLDLPGSSPQDIKLDPGGHTFYVADKNHAGVWLIDANTFRPISFIPTGPDAHGLYPSRDAHYLYVTNRGNGSITVINFATAKIAQTWWIPGGGSPDMGGVSPDGRVLWLSGRYNNVVYAISTADGRLLAEIPVGAQPHGLCVWPQPGRYSLGHTGITR
jgi:YVTN family beta-propeller protein